MGKEQSLDEYQDLRREMVVRQLQRRGITNKLILEQLDRIPRHLFVSAPQRVDAYSDQPLPISNGQTISQPFVVALMLEYLDLHPNDEVLEIGSGSGYATAILSGIAKHVHAIEVFSELIESAQTVLDSLQVDNVLLEHRSAWEQSQEKKVYDRIVLWASPSRIPEYLFQHLKEGGILVSPEGKQDQYIWVMQKRGGRLTKEKKDSVRFVPLVQGTTEEIDRYR